MFPEKHVRVFPETRTRICKNTYVFWVTLLDIYFKWYKIYTSSAFLVLLLMLSY